MQCCDATGRIRQPAVDFERLNVAYILLADVSTAGKLFKSHLREIEEALLDYLCSSSIFNVFDPSVAPDEASLCNHFAVCALMARFYGKDLQAEMQEQHGMSAAQQSSQHLPDGRLRTTRMFAKAFHYILRVRLDSTARQPVN